MKVFLSWSGPRSQGVAKAFHAWLPTVIQQVEPWISTESIAKGETWLSSIRDALSTSNGIGLFFLTREAAHSDWLLYEAGGIAALGQGRVCTVCIDIEPHDLKPPLSFFQATVLKKDDVLKLVEDLNKFCQPQLTTTLLRKSFEYAWPELEAELVRLRQEQPLATVATKPVAKPDGLGRDDGHLGRPEANRSAGGRDRAAAKTAATLLPRRLPTSLYGRSGRR